MAWKILITDGFEDSGVKALISQGFEVDMMKLPAEQLIEFLPRYQGIIVRSATKVRSELIANCPDLKFIARAGVGLDNIDVEFAQSRNIRVINTPASSSRSVAEIALGHMFCLTRGLHRSNRELNDAESFSKLKKELSSSIELQGKTLLLIGIGRIGRELAKMALGLEMRVIACDPFIDKAEIELHLQGQAIQIPIPLVAMEQGLSQADYVSLHSPYTGKALLDAAKLALLKNTAYIVNTSRGENINEDALLHALNEHKIAGAGLDVYQNEPNIRKELLNHPKISVSPHIGASTYEAQQRIAEEMVEKIVSYAKEII
ncbi:MAG: 3-phosphoglycerate dehydrogenase [Saprospiraceae bacterium]|nr:3-phosphoglycerate dehydrogenase [Saprospiraceae bacterium]